MMDLTLPYLTTDVDRFDMQDVHKHFSEMFAKQSMPKVRKVHFSVLLMLPDEVFINEWEHNDDSVEYFGSEQDYKKVREKAAHLGLSRDF